MEVGYKTKEKNRKTIDETKKNLNESIVNGKKHENKETEERAKMIKNLRMWQQLFASVRRSLGANSRI